MTPPGATRAILTLGWPMFVGQLAVMANGIIDNVMAGHLSAADLAAVAIGSSVYYVVFVGLMGTLSAISPVAAQHFGAGRLHAVGDAWRQGQWLALALLLPGWAALAFPGPLLALARPEPAIEAAARTYLGALAFGLPAALWFRAFTTLNTAVSRPRVVMAINLLGPVLKVPLNALFMHGSDAPTAIGLPAVPALGGAGCGVATACVFWVSAAIAAVLLARDPFYRRFSLRGIGAPHRRQLGELLRLGIPIGATYLIDVSAFNVVTLLVARLGTATVGGHAIAANLAATTYMLPLAMAGAVGVLAAQALGRGDRAQARQVVGHGLRLVGGLALLVAAALWLAREPIARAYTDDAQVARVAASLLGFVALYHVADAVQVTYAFALRAWKVAVLPMVVFALALWGIGLGGGAMLAFGRSMGATGFWIAAILALVVAATALALLFERTTRRPGEVPARG